MTLRDELRQTKPFPTLEQEAMLNIVRTSARLLDVLEQALKPYGITATQYNVLRILRGSAPGGLSRNDLRDRMLTRMPDVTRLLDRMVEAGLVARKRGGGDRRLVTTHISERALKLLAELDDVVIALQAEQFAAASEAEMHTLIELLTRIRNG